MYLSSQISYKEEMKNDLALYDRHANQWWKPGSRMFGSLQAINRQRFEQIREIWPDLNGRKVLDIGCGGGLLSVPLIEAGADVTGIDLSYESLRVASEKSRGRGKFLRGCASALPFSLNTKFDLVVLSDVLEHVDDYRDVLIHASRFVTAGGYMYISTINKTLRSYLLAVLLGEGIGLIPKHTHDWNLFICPNEMKQYLEGACQMRRTVLQGERPGLFETLRNRAISLRNSHSHAISYRAIFQKVPYEA